MNTPTIISDRLALLDTVNLGRGAHATSSQGMCALEAVAWLAGERHSDKPSCACPVIAGILRNWNDQLPDDEHRNRLIRPLLTNLIGTRIVGDAKKSDSVLLKRMWLVQDWNMRVRTPAFLRLAKLEAEAAALAAMPEITDLAALSACTEVANNASRAASAAYSAAYSAARSAADSAADSAAYSAADSAAYSAAKAVFADTLNALHASFADVIKRMCEVTE